MLEFLLVCGKAGEFRIERAETSMVRRGNSHLSMDLVDALLRTLELRFEARQLLSRLTRLGSRGDRRSSLIAD